MDDQKIIDRQRIEELRSEVGDEDFAEIAGLFLEEMSAEAAALPAHKDPAKLSDAFHSMKGAALNLGFAEVARLCADGERAPDTANIAVVTAACTAAQDAFSRLYSDVSV